MMVGKLWISGLSALGLTSAMISLSLVFKASHGANPICAHVYESLRA